MCLKREVKVFTAFYTVSAAQEERLSTLWQWTHSKSLVLKKPSSIAWLSYGFCFECKDNLSLLHIAYAGVKEEKAKSSHHMQAQWWDKSITKVYEILLISAGSLGLSLPTNNWLLSCRRKCPSAGASSTFLGRLSTSREVCLRFLSART